MCGPCGVDIRGLKSMSDWLKWDSRFTSSNIGFQLYDMLHLLCSVVPPASPRVLAPHMSTCRPSPLVIHVVITSATPSAFAFGCRHSHAESSREQDGIPTTSCMMTYYYNRGEAVVKSCNSSHVSRYSRYISQRQQARGDRRTSTATRVSHSLGFRS